MQIDRQAAFTGTKEVAAALKFPVAPLEAYLADKVAGFAGPLTVRQFKGGQSNPTYLLETPARRYVLRRKPPGKLLPSAHAVDREFRAISGLYPQGFPVAEPVLYCDDPGLIGTAFYVMGFADGRVFWEPDMPQSDSTAGASSLLGRDLGALGIPTRDAYVDAYVARTGLDPRPYLPVYLAYNFFRITAIIQGIVGRVRDGTATSEFAPARAQMVRPMAAKAWEFARAAGAK